MNEKELSQIAVTIVKVLQQMQTFKDWLVGLVCQALFGVQTPTEAQQKIIEIAHSAAERFNGGLTAAQTMSQDDFNRMFDTALQDPERVKNLASIVSQLRRGEIQTKEAERVSAVRTAVALRYGQDNVAEPLVVLVKNKTVLTGRPDRWPEELAKQTIQLEKQMTDAIGSLPTKGRKKIPTGKIPNYTAFLMAEGIDPDNQMAVYHALVERDELKGILAPMGGEN